MLALLLLQVSTAQETPPVIRPAPDPWPTHEYACQLVQNEAKRIARREPKAGERFSDLSQIVDCDARTVTRMATLNIKSVKLAQSAQLTADKLPCVSPA